MKKIKAAAAALAVAGATAVSLVTVTGPAQAAGCVGEVVSWTKGVAHSSCKAGSGYVRSKIQCMDPSGMVYYKYGTYTYSHYIDGGFDTASCNGNGSILKKWAQVR
ncbi:hypothetical protein [Actinoplanes utahensis]|uniref:Uncharacterized protein n=1 Tax=Actinoplanes utahensis TaxID=1869 RepID=A0A0A6UQX9_ACTUT|nr:hypothetical protein [Actinoplanes utahensis]KHD76779.1 hypothetical protein MB27_14540 [Actinoplanes utahensis]GIF33326.1 hypothetical protein Aut01nite_63120 [Actinoplanes utahensis]